jgi:TonB family protein
MKQTIFVFLLFAILENSHAQNYVRFLDKYGYEVDDSKNPEYAFFELIQSQGRMISIHRFSKDSLKILEKSFVFDSLGNELASNEKEFYASKKTKSVIRKEKLAEEVLAKQFYETGNLKSEILSRKDEVVYEKYFNLAGDEITKPELTAASPKGGLKGWNNYLASELRYPSEARAVGAEGMVILEFDLDSDGGIKNLKVLNQGENHKSIELEALRVLEKYPHRWTPALENGIPVESRVKLPLKFKLG